MSIEKSDSQDLTDQDNEAYLQNYTKLFKKLHKFKTSTEIEIRVYQGSKEFGISWSLFIKRVGSYVVRAHLT